MIRGGEPQIVSGTLVEQERPVVRSGESQVSWFDRHRDLADRFYDAIPGWFERQQNRADDQLDRVRELLKQTQLWARDAAAQTGSFLPRRRTGLSEEREPPRRDAFALARR